MSGGDPLPRRSLQETLASTDRIREYLTPDGDTITQWSADKGEKLRQWQFPGWVRRLAVTAEDRYLLTSNQNGTVYVLRLEPPPGKAPP